MLGCKHIHLERQYRVAFIPAAVVIKPMTFRGFLKVDYYWRQQRCIPTPHISYSQALLQPPNSVLKIEIARRFGFFFFASAYISG